MRARVHDPAGPAPLRTAIAVGGYGLLAAGLFSSTGAMSWALLLTGAAIAYPLRAFMSRLAPRDAEVALEPGALSITGAGLLDQHIAGSALRGGFTALSPHGARVVLSRGGYGRPPLILELASESDARAVMAAIGAGRMGFGEVTWALGDALNDTLVFATRGVAGLFWVAFGFFCALSGAGATFASGIAFALALAATALCAYHDLASLVGRPSTLTLRPDAVVVRRRGQEVTVPCREIVRVIPQTRAITFATSRPELAALVRCEQVRHTVTGPSSEERELLIEQIQAAIQRSRAPATEHDEAAAEVARADGESARGWLERLEVAAAALAGGVYRQSRLEASTLWHVLEDHDRAPHARAGAARLLLRVAPESKTRIGEVMTSMRNEADRSLVRVATEPNLDVAAQEIEALDRARTGE